MHRVTAAASRPSRQPPPDGYLRAPVTMPSSPFNVALESDPSVPPRPAWEVVLVGMAALQLTTSLAGGLSSLVGQAGVECDAINVSTAVRKAVNRCCAQGQQNAPVLTILVFVSSLLLPLPLLFVRIVPNTLSRWLLLRRTLFTISTTPLAEENQEEVRLKAMSSVVVDELRTLGGARATQWPVVTMLLFIAMLWTFFAVGLVVVPVSVFSVIGNRSFAAYLRNGTTSSVCGSNYYCSTCEQTRCPALATASTQCYAPAESVAIFWLWVATETVAGLAMVWWSARLLACVYCSWQVRRDGVDALGTSPDPVFGAFVEPAEAPLREQLKRSPKEELKADHGFSVAKVLRTHRWLAAMICWMGGDGRAVQFTRKLKLLGEYVLYNRARMRLRDLLKTGGAEFYNKDTKLINVLRKLYMNDLRVIEGSPQSLISLSSGQSNPKKWNVRYHFEAARPLDDKAKVFRGLLRKSDDARWTTCHDVSREGGRDGGTGGASSRSGGGPNDGNGGVGLAAVPWNLGENFSDALRKRGGKPWPATGATPSK